MGDLKRLQEEVTFGLNLEMGWRELYTSDKCDYEGAPQDVFLLHPSYILLSFGWTGLVVTLPYMPSLLTSGQERVEKVLASRQGSPLV